MKLLLVLAFCFLPSIALGAVGFDVCSTSSTTAATSLTWSHTVSGGSTLLIVTFHGEGDSGGQVSGITYNDIPMTPLELYYPNSDPGPGLEIYYLIAPATGANNVIISNLNNIAYVGSACSFTGVDQVTPTGTTVKNATNPLDSGSVTVPASGMAYEVGLWGRNDDCVSPVPQAAPSQTKQFDDCADPAGAGSIQLGFGSTRTTTGSFTWNGAPGYAGAVAIPINAAEIAAPVLRRKPIMMQ